MCIYFEVSNFANLYDWLIKILWFMDHTLWANFKALTANTNKNNGQNCAAWML